MIRVPVPCISIAGGEKLYPSSRGAIMALRGIDLDVADGEFVSLLGPSGCGKSTLLRCIAGLEQLSAGTASIHGQPILSPPDGIAMVFQRDALLDWRSIIGNVVIAAQLRGHRAALYRDRGMALLERFGLAGFADRYPWELSGGMQQRTALARAMVSEPRLLMMDEPFASVDALTRNHLEDMVLDIWAQSNFAILMVTHDVGEAVYLSDRVLVLSARPSEVLAEIKVDLQRPRTQLETRSSKAFVELQAQVLERVEHAGRRAVGLVADEA